MKSSLISPFPAQSMMYITQRTWVQSPLLSPMVHGVMMICDVARGKNSELDSTGGARESAGKIAHHNQLVAL